MQKIYYTMDSLSSRDEIFFRSIIVMHNSRNDEFYWERDDSNYQVLVVGKGYDEQNLFTPHNKVNVIISMDPELQLSGYNVVYVALPVRATELLQNIIQAEQLSRSDTPSSISLAPQDKQIKLLRWPDASILAQDKIYPMLSALLSKRALSVSELVTMSKGSEDTCNKFIMLIISQGDAEYIDIMPEAPLPEKKVKRGLLDRIKASLGLN